VKILIVDDEILVRIGIKSCAEWDKYGMEIIGEAEDGLRAIELIESLKPDIVLLDIKMPKMDGLQVMRHIKERNFDCKVVILSSFDDFEHIGEAMKLGMADYLHKPRMNSQDIVNALLIVKDSIEKSRKLKSEEAVFNKMQISETLSKETLLKQLLSGALGSSGLMSKKLQNAGISLGNYNIGCILFSISNIGTVMKRYENAGRNVLQAFVSNIMNGILEAEKGTEYLSYSENVHAVITSSDIRGSENNAFSHLSVLENLITDALMRFLNVKAVFGVSDVFQDLSSASVAFSQASKALDMHFYRDSKTSIHYRELAKIDANEARRQIDKLVELIKEHIANAQFEKSLEIFDKLTEIIYLNACLSKDEVKGLFNGLLFLTRGGQSSLSDMEELSLCESFSELCQAYKKIFSDRAQKDANSIIKPEYSYLVKRIMNFIKTNYTNDITLKSIAEALQVSPNYVSRVFKAETGRSPFDFLNTVRIDSAKRLLADSSLKIYEIGYKVGFKSPVHFTVVFSKHVKMSPKQYRDKL
jgi:two-component system response regulator YesN